MNKPAIKLIDVCLLTPRLSCQHKLHIPPQGVCEQSEFKLKLSIKIKSKTNIFKIR